MRNLPAGSLSDPFGEPVGWLSGRGWFRAAAIVVLVLAVYVAAFSPQWWVGKDGALYLILGRNLARGEGYVLAGRAHALVPPGLPAVLAVLMRLGIGSFLAINIVMGVMGLACVLVAYLLVRRIVHRDWALLVAAAFGLSNELLQRSGEVLSDVPFTLLILSALWLYYRGLGRDKPARGAWEAGSLLLVGACWVRMAGLMLAAGGAIGLLLSAGREARRRALVNFAVVLVGCAVTLWLFYAHAAANPDPIASSYIGLLRSYAGSMTLAERIATPFIHFGEASREFSRLLFCQTLPGLVCLLFLVAPVAVVMVGRIVRRDRVGPLVVACYIAGMCAAMVRIRTRYLLPVAPLLVLYLLEAYVWAARRLWARRDKAGQAVAAGLLVLVVGLNAVHVGRNIVDKHRPDYPTEQQGGNWRDLPAVVEFLKANRPAGGRMLGEFAYGYLADIPVPMLPRALRYSSPTDAELRRLLADMNVRVIVLHTDEDKSPFYEALTRFLRQLGPPAFIHGVVEVHVLPEPAAASTEPADSPETPAHE